VADLAGERRELLVRPFELRLDALQVVQRGAQLTGAQLQLEQVDDPLGERLQGVLLRGCDRPGLVVEDAEGPDDDALG
jgi:hypothetical protein